MLWLIFDGSGGGTNSEVLAVVAEGRTNPEIGVRLSISGRTVQKHLEHIYEKFRVRTRTAAATKLTVSSLKGETADLEARPSRP